MPTIIDSLVVELGFDIDGLDAGRKKVEEVFKKTTNTATKAGKDIEKSAKSAGDFLTRLRNNVLGLFAAFTAGRGIKDFVSEMTTTDAALGRFARTVGMSAKEVATWRAAGSLMGVDAKDIDSTFTNLTQQFQQFALTGDSTVVPYFRALGINMSDATGKMRPMAALLFDLSNRIKGMDPQKAIAFMNGLGIAPGMQQIILQGPAAIQKLLDSQKALAEAQARDAPAAARRQQAWNDFLNQATAVGVVLLETLTPAIIGLTNAAKAFAEWGERHPEMVGAAFAALTGIVLALTAAIAVSLVGGAIATAVAGFTALTGLVGGLGLSLAILTETALPALSSAFLALGVAIEATPIGWVITAIAGISIAGYELVKHWDDVRRWWRSLWGDMGTDAQDGSQKAQDGIKGLQGGKAAPKGGAPSGGPAAVPTGPQAEADIQTLTGMGWTRAQATGIVANIHAESGGRSNAEGDNGQSYGLGQWHPDRQARFKEWTGKDIRTASRQEQLAFINYELRGPEKRAGAILAQTETAEHAARAVNTYYERPADIAGQNAARSAIASTLSSGGAPRAAAGGNYNHQTSEVRVGEVKVYTQATDAKGLAKDLKPALQRDEFAQQANFGPA